MVSKVVEPLVEPARVPGMPGFQLTSRWTPLRRHPEQYRLWTSPARFRVVPAGRRSGKTELAKRFVVMKAVAFNAFSDGWFIVAAPTRDQARRIFWNDLKALVPPVLIDEVRESELTIKLKHNGAKIGIVGMDKPERVEGSPIDGIILDEYADMRESCWGENVRPALSTPGRPGWAWFTGVPGGRNHYWRTYMNALSADYKPTWDAFHWTSSTVMDEQEITEARRDLDPMTFQQEYEASFITFEGRVYYAFNRAKHAFRTLKRFKDRPIAVCLDFNVRYGAAVVVQEQTRADYAGDELPEWVADEFTAVLGEVYILNNSNTERVCNTLIERFGDEFTDHWYFYGDATGGAAHTSQVAGSDWDIARDTLRPHLRSRVHFRIAEANPRERVRVNAVNTRLMRADSKVHMLLDNKRCPNLIIDLDGVIWLEGADGSIDKWDNPALTHLSDGLGYYIVRRFPITSTGFSTSRIGH